MEEPELDSQGEEKKLMLLNESRDFEQFFQEFCKVFDYLAQELIC